jgi:hypothetical protein
MMFPEGNSFFGIGNLLEISKNSGMPDEKSNHKMAKAQKYKHKVSEESSAYRI